MKKIRDLEKAEVGMNILRDSTCNVLNISKSELLSKSRAAKIVAARRIICYIGHEKYQNAMSLNTIGNYVRKDHATVLHYKRKHGHLYGQRGEEIYTSQFNKAQAEFNLMIKHGGEINGRIALLMKKRSRISTQLLVLMDKREKREEKFTKQT